MPYRPFEKEWLKGTAKVMKGKYDKADAVNPNFLNHVTWYVATGWNRTYPGEDIVSTREKSLRGRFSKDLSTK